MLPYGNARRLEYHKNNILYQLLFTYRKGFTLQEALEIAYNDDVEDIFIEPPDPNVLTDEDSGDEDEGGLLDNLPGAQLRAKAEVVLSNKDRIGNFAETNNVPEINEALQEPVTTSVFSPVKETDWIQGDLMYNEARTFPGGSYTKYRDLSPVALFEQFFDIETMMYLTDQISRYALFKNRPDPKVTVDELKCYIGILLLSGYNQLPGKRYYWENQEDVRNNLVYNAMRRNRFLQISQFLHCADNNTPDLTDKVWKLRPLMDRIKEKCLQNFEPEEKLCYDESMIKYYGKHSCKQFIRGKPIRFGYKMWCLNTVSGYLVNFEIYQGNSPRRNVEYERFFGKAAAPFVQMLDELPEKKRYLPYQLYFDNLFTGLNLLYYLKQQGYNATGTIRENRLSKNCPLSDKKRFQKNYRGIYESAIERTCGIIVVRWLDNNVVTVASTCHGIFPNTNVRRFSQAEKQMITVPRPNVIGQYNSSMGGTDLMDENINRYRIGIRGKKWWWCQLTWLIDVCINNGWQLHKKAGGSFQQLNFRREIANNYLKTYGSVPKGPGRPATSRSSITLNRVSDNLRYDRLDHLVESCPGNKRRRCAGEGCSSHVRTMCKKCDVGLCIPCFSIFHTNQYYFLLF